MATEAQSKQEGPRQPAPSPLKLLPNSRLMALRELLRKSEAA